MREARRYDRRAMARRSRARYLAPIALAATIAGTYVIVHDALSAKTKAAHTPVVIAPVRPHGKFAKSKYYAVQPGDIGGHLQAHRAVGLEHGGHAKAFAAHFVNHVMHGSVRCDTRQSVAGMHGVLDAQKFSSEAAGGMQVGKILGLEAAAF